MLGNFCITAGLSGGRWPHARVNPSGSSPLVCKVPEVPHTSDAMLGGSSFSWSFGPNDLENKIKLTTSTLEVCGGRDSSELGTHARLAGRGQHSASAPQSSAFPRVCPSVPRSPDLVEQTLSGQVPSDLFWPLLARMAAVAPLPCPRLLAA